MIVIRKKNLRPKQVIFIRKKNLVDPAKLSQSEVSIDAVLKERASSGYEPGKSKKGLKK